MSSQASCPWHAEAVAWRAVHTSSGVYDPTGVRHKGQTLTFIYAPRESPNGVRRAPFHGPWSPEPPNPTHTQGCSHPWHAQ